MSKLPLERITMGLSPSELVTQALAKLSLTKS